MPRDRGKSKSLNAPTPKEKTHQKRRKKKGGTVTHPAGGKKRKERDELLSAPSTKKKGSAPLMKGASISGQHRVKKSRD